MKNFMIKMKGIGYELSQFMLTEPNQSKGKLPMNETCRNKSYLVIVKGSCAFHFTVLSRGRLLPVHCCGAGESFNRHPPTRFYSSLVKNNNRSASVATPSNAIATDAAVSASCAVLTGLDSVSSGDPTKEIWLSPSTRK